MSETRDRNLIPPLVFGLPGGGMDRQIRRHLEDQLRCLTDEVCLLVEIFDDLPVEFRRTVLDAWTGVAMFLASRAVRRRLARRSIARDAIEEVVNRCTVSRDILAFEQVFE